MASQIPPMILKAIGTVSNKVKQAPGADYNWQEVVSQITVDSSLTEALDGLEEFSHITVLYWMHQVKATTKMPTKIHPMGKPELPLTGLFATRSPYRPNPIGQTTVRLLKRQGNILTVAGLDAINGTPVIDIKPYLPGYDSSINATVPSWIPNR